MTLGPHDLHFTFSRFSNRLKGFDHTGKLLINVEARNRTTRDGQLYHDGNCPAGVFLLGEPVPKHQAAFGPWFVGLNDWAECHVMRAYRRSGIGIHGGGSGLPDPFAPHQSPPWIVTHGCIRLINQDLEEVVHLIRSSHGAGGKCYLTVDPPVPGAAAEPEDDYLPVDEDSLAPGE